MALLILSFVAGVLTVLAPCILPLLPIIIGGSLQEEHNRLRPFIITFSLALSIIFFTLLLKFSTALIDIPSMVWSVISGTIIIIFGLLSNFPTVWEKISVKFNLGGRSNKLLSKTVQKKTYWGEVLMGAALGPVFSSCSPTYFVILATVLPQSFGVGLVYLVVYALGLSLVLLLISFLGQKFVKHVGFAANPKGWFKRSLGVLFVLVGIFIMTGADKKVQTAILDVGYLDSTHIESSLLDVFGITKNTTELPDNVDQAFPRYHEFQKPTAFLNSEPFALKDIVGKKVIMLDFMTYSCINCLRTIPYVNAWYDKYKNQGLEIVGIHAPEFSFERKVENVKAALLAQGIKFPVVMDNDFGTWQAYGNYYWPSKYLIDINGRVVYNHTGEGEYEEVEQKIQQLLQERQTKLGDAGVVSKDYVELSNVETPEPQSPEIYFGSERNEYLGNGSSFSEGKQIFTEPIQVNVNTLYLGGTWNITREYAENMGKAKIIFRYRAKSVYMVASSDKGSVVTILKDGVPLDTNFNIKEDKLYTLIQDQEVGEHVLEIIIPASGLKAFTFTFG
jgi:cytochrome c biogenesis protein CcdA/thiol-disulfide isomerase/thioredoxin